MRSSEGFLLSMEYTIIGYILNNKRVIPIGTWQNACRYWQGEIYLL